MLKKNMENMHIFKRNFDLIHNNKKSQFIFWLILPFNNSIQFKSFWCSICKTFYRFFFMFFVWTKQLFLNFNLTNFQNNHCTSSIRNSNGTDEFFLFSGNHFLLSFIMLCQLFIDFKLKTFTDYQSLVNRITTHWLLLIID